MTDQALWALSIRQPWAQLLALGLKRYETRSWPTAYRGPILIHAGKSRGDPDERLVRMARARKLDLSRVPIGGVVGVAMIEDVLAAEEVRSSCSRFELAAGDFSDGRFAWKMTTLLCLDSAVPTGGKLGIFGISGKSLTSEEAGSVIMSYRQAQRIAR